MTLVEKIEELYIDTLMELTELSSFKTSTLRGYELIEDQYNQNVLAVEEQISNSKDKWSSVERIRLRVDALQRGIHSLNGIKASYVNKINKSIVIYTCSIFDYFLNQTIRLVMLDKPELLSSEKKIIPFHELLSKSKAEIIESMIDKHIHEFSYKSIGDRIKYMCDKFELDINFLENKKVTAFYSNEINLDAATKIFAIRNIIIHNQGKVNKVFLDTVRSSKLRLNSPVVINDSIIEESIKSLMITASSICRQFAVRYF